MDDVAGPQYLADRTASANDRVMPTVMMSAWPRLSPVRDCVVRSEAFILLPSASSYVKAMCGSAQNSFTVSKLSSESVAFWLKLSSASVSCRRNLLRRSLEPGGHHVAIRARNEGLASGRWRAELNRGFIMWVMTRLA